MDLNVVLTSIRMLTSVFIPDAEVRHPVFALTPRIKHCPKIIVREGLVDLQTRFNCCFKSSRPMITILQKDLVQ